MNIILRHSLVLLAGTVLAACSNVSERAAQSESQIQLPLQNAQTDMAAHWLRPDMLVAAKRLNSGYLVASLQASLDDTGVADEQIALTAVEQPDWLASQYPHLRDFYTYQVTIPETKIKSLLSQQLAVIDMNNGVVNQLSYLQTSRILDYLYTRSDNDADEIDHYGAHITGDQTQFTLWAPTAKSVKVRLYDNNKNPLESGIINLTFDDTTGAWSGSTRNAPQGTYYRYQLHVYHPSSQAFETLQVTDPYSLSLSTNSQFSQVVDLSSSQTQPAQWQSHTVPTVESPEELILYEAHVRDFSAFDKSLSDPALAGKYAAFNQSHSDSMKHLKALVDAGLNTLHLLPVYDISTVDEQPANVINLSDSLARVCELAPQIDLCQTDYAPQTTLETQLQSYSPLSGDAQQVIEQIRAHDPYNWGYDPYHYTVPEGSYALNPEGIPRIVEFRQMVQRLHQLGLRVIMDVVYNHTFAAGLAEKSVLDKVVPNYYHRLNPLTGAIEQSTCCENSATEHKMMEKLMVDSLVVWARDYKIDGFRFDLMGHQPKSVMLTAREAVREVDPDTYFYGEGWNFGEVANNAQFVQASQPELAGTEIGTFTDRLRDAIRGGSSFVYGDDLRKGQGLGNGLLTVPNELTSNGEQEALRDEYLLSMDQARVGLVANLAIYPLENAAGKRVFGRDIDYGGAPTGYALDPADTINYVSKHDNQTLWDNNQYRIAASVSTEERVRMQVLSLAYPLFAQGIPFIHMGSELLRSKSYLRDSYDYGDWFNRVDFSKQSNNYHVGMPPAQKDQANWQVIQRIIGQNQGRDIAWPEHISQASNQFMDLLKIRTSTPLFSLTTADSIIRRVKFHNTGPQQQLGLIVMSIDDPYSRDLDPNFEELMVLFNNDDQAITFEYLGAERFSLHPILQQGSDQQIKAATATVDGFTVPALSVAVFVR